MVFPTSGIPQVMAASAYNCSLDGSLYAYNTSQSPAVTFQLCRQLLNAKCVRLGLEQSLCINSHSPATGAVVRSTYESEFCNAYFNESDAIATFILGWPILAAFLINAAVLAVRARQ